MVAAFSPDLVSDGLHAGKFISGVAKMCGGGGGGRPNLAQAGGSQPQSLDLALEKANEDLTQQFDKFIQINHKNGIFKID